MSVVVSNCNQICNSPLNLSRSKQLYSFPKQSRFQEDINMKNKCAQAFYDLPNARSKRFASIGYGKKYDFTQNQKHAPGPNVYQIKSIFESGKHNGFTFGLGRDQLSSSGTFQKKLGPGPGAYEIKSMLSKTAYSLRIKTKSMGLISPELVKVPGPGTYENLPSINDKGKYVLSKISNSKACMFNPPSSKRFGLDQKDKIPGPGNYNPKNDMGNGGQYVLSKFKNSLGKSFTHTFRTTGPNQAKQTPGPGTYRLPSEFGYYEAAKK